MGAFEPAAGAYFAALAENNSRAWFHEHRGDYDRLVREPLEDLLAAASPVYGDGRVMRANRDVRFSVDKSPYRTDAGMWAGRVGGVYVQVSADGVGTGGGLYAPARDQLDRGREAIDGDEAAAEQLAQIVDDLEADGFELAGPSLMTAPRGHPRDHPSIALLRLQHYAALRPLPFSATVDDITDCWRQVDPLIAWVDEHVGAAAVRPRR